VHIKKVHLEHVTVCVMSVLESPSALASTSTSVDDAYDDVLAWKATLSSVVSSDWIDLARQRPWLRADLIFTYHTVSPTC
jgi:hypothetical protein